ncbi:SACE_7040 family transcriptional regulator [Actinoalloteichus hymeniacidonis]|uniref:Transcriptional regulator, TetR family n=1 Tax=Actinoalloteichus hymeniacidonis TaxID=340345 RepID=A0AAC9HUG6_9PSEU|nr:TetR/AcrR family transcriptional regulator [Actinoalloteichus hymeniacidonis]AOS65366.1 transcriptional regulator, TetR family [Actinoalloteichus hymeniacidonis]MBB5906548.1 AcrR family transcriptional regulator [Actinoalloteichus hymeniacidonis]
MRQNHQEESTGTRRRSAERRQEILDAAAELFAARGYHGVSIEDLGRAVGVSGPALYRHFRNKEAVLAEMLLAVSERLLTEGTARVAAAEGPAAALDALIEWHVEFALSKPALITVHDRELDNVPEAERRTVRRLQRRYVEEWVAVAARIAPHTARGRLLAATHAAFGLLNSTPHSATNTDLATMRTLLATMAHAALSSAWEPNNGGTRP